MLPSRILMNAAKKSNKPPVPVEMYPLFFAVGIAVSSACYFTYRHFAHDKHLRLWKNADLSALDDVLNEQVKKEALEKEVKQE
ncbi:hypothetical protein PSN45_002130 [Yamadazyma tenuis]|uniref:Uncharacterized protein n=1 Tax=Candida tenuis (strain ATCC 10573 / BCRC 21748 / CBS 615 / JCM 9827 / NBRC 10315 / NRRL Y-1498 / VKM Y-70) TaxID=590646 RepID=G3BC64_CANTC|nr:uncharacterized protein CANTEDRAFT_116148 [Yamadazyma tenuis ATCC 10573]XP_006690232.1 uncharacterized protein CANTEDRAFT_116148 [Yamadazyma tenuis ATCC 10573]EGV61017.1 hypothetical protein CANTEDRAFT_116148 [Yamadazyma tenuis ATCC 10573]EGV61018.1 hypothetical protein CANTEDRAFT_116148 [Yamadazyma tenuis ATCC 10573]WEJ94639.1 hypothetical protein PSN45_002130 [Yamadazyma tenuis]